MKTSKKILAVLLTVLTVFGIVCFAASAEDNIVYAIYGNINVTINTPIAGEKPSIEALTSSDGFTVTAFSWYDKATGEIIDAAGTDFVFADGGEYTAKITVTPNDGYEFAEDLTITVNDEAPATIRYKDNTITVECHYSCSDDSNTGSDFFTGLKNTLLQILRIIRDLILHFIGY